MSHLERARRALRDHDYAHAVERLEAHLTLHPDDLEAQVELGLAYYLAGETARFEAQHRALEPHAPKIALSARLSRMWAAQRGFIEGLARAAALAGLATAPLAVSGCAPGDGVPAAQAQPIKRTLKYGVWPMPRPIPKPLPKPQDAGVKDAAPAPPVAPAPPTEPDPFPGVNPEPAPVVPTPARPKPKYGIRLKPEPELKPKPEPPIKMKYGFIDPFEGR